MIVFNLIILLMLTLNKKPYNPNYGPSTTEDINWNKSDILSFLDNIHNVPLNDITISGKGISFYQTATKAEIASELISTINLTHYKLLSAVKDVVNYNNLLINQTQKRNDSIDFCVKEIKKLATQTQRNNFLLLKFVHNNPDLPLADSTIHIDEPIRPIIDEQIDQTINGSPEQTINTDLIINDLADKIKVDANVNNNETDAILRDIFNEPQSPKSTKSITNPLPNKPHLEKKIKKKKSKKKHNYNKNKNKKNKQRNKQQKPSKHSGYVVSNNCTSMTLTYTANKQRKKRYNIINPIRKDIEIKTRYGIYHTSKCLEKQLQDILPYEEYIKDEQQAYNELNEQINYAVFNR